MAKSKNILTLTVNYPLSTKILAAKIFTLPSLCARSAYPIEVQAFPTGIFSNERTRISYVVN